jgi:hypothetical protein
VLTVLASPVVMLVMFGTISMYVLYTLRTFRVSGVAVVKCKACGYILYNMCQNRCPECGLNQNCRNR